MNAISSKQAQSRLPELMSEVTQSHVPIEITENEYSCILLSADDWRAIQETLYPLSIPGMRESIREGMDAPLSDCSEEIW